MSEYTSKLRSKLEYEIKIKRQQIAILQEKIIEDEKELEQLLLNKCPHSSTNKIHATSGASCLQTIKCNECGLVLEQEWGSVLFHPSLADVYHSSGN